MEQNNQSSQLINIFNGQIPRVVDNALIGSIEQRGGAVKFINFPFFHVNQHRTTKYDICFAIISNLYASYKLEHPKFYVGNGSVSFLANLIINGDDAFTAYSKSVEDGYIQLQEYPGKKSKGFLQNINLMLRRICANPETNPVSLYSSHKMQKNTFILERTPLCIEISDFINSIPNDAVVSMSHELMIVH